MLWPCFCALVPDSLVFAGHALTLFLLSPRKYRLRSTSLLWIGVFLICVLIPLIGMLFGREIPNFARHMSSLVICGIAFLLSSEGPYLQNLFLFASYINYFVFSFAVAQAIASGFINNDPIAIIEFRLIFILVFCVVVACDIRPYFPKVAKNVRHGWFSLTMLATIFSVCLVAMMFMSDFFVHGDTQTISMLVALFVIMASAYVVIFILIQTLNKESQEQKLEMEGKFLREQLTTYEQLEQESRKNRHDFRHHNLLILEYAKNKNTDAIIQYLQEYEAAAESIQLPRFCANVTVNSVVTAFARRAQETGIKMSVDIRIGKMIFVKDTHMVAILANLLENALKGSLLSKENPWVDLFMVQKKQKLIIQCKNSCADNIHFSNGLPRAVGRTGVGVTSIIDTVSDYAGNTEFSSDDGVFTCRMVLNDPAISN